MHLDPFEEIDHGLVVVAFGQMKWILRTAAYLCSKVRSLLIEDVECRLTPPPILFGDISVIYGDDVFVEGHEIFFPPSPISVNA